MKQQFYLGIDTSCYTTSVALFNDYSQLVAEARKTLEVKAGKRGLQQSEMVFQHTRNLPNLIEKVIGGESYLFDAIGVSGAPRPIENSYMPAFLSGVAVARSIAATSNASIYIISHQENHLEAGLWSASWNNAERFLMLHASGGTTDLLVAEKQATGRYKLSLIGGSIDLHAGQFVDRIGVALGLQFPAGPALEHLANMAINKATLPLSVNKMTMSLSGPATAAQRLIDAGIDGATIALGVEYVLAETFAKVLLNATEAYNVRNVLLVGGVNSNNYIRIHIKERLAKKNIKLWIPEAQFSCDNAVGCAAFAWRMKHG